MKDSLRNSQKIILEQLYKEYYHHNSKAYPGLYGISNKYSLVGLMDVNIESYAFEWKHPDVTAKHYVELLIRQGGLLPAGQYGEGAEDFNIKNNKFRHHIDFYKPSLDVMNLIMLGDLHYKYTTAEGAKNLDYYTRMRGMRDGFQDAIPPSFWESDLQDLYIERLIEFVTEWENNGVIQYTWKGPNRYIINNGIWVVDNSKVDFIKMNYQGKTYNLQEMLIEGWVTEDFIDNIIANLRQKLESRGLI